MTKARKNYRPHVTHDSLDPMVTEEDRGLLSFDSSEDEEDIKARPRQQNEPSPSPTPTPRNPRTSNRVRFDLPTADDHDDDTTSSRRQSGESSPLGLDSHCTPHIPLLGHSQTLSIEPAHSSGSHGDVELLAEQEYSRPRSGLRSAFTNMTNSIIGAGIIGQPYAFRQAGLVTGIILLLTLTVVVDWTIRLIVINSKLCGRRSFQGTVEYCFGRKGLIAISVAQWAFAFGGMVAFGIIIGDSIPHVFAVIWPELQETPVLNVLTSRRAVIVIFILGISYPLSLYRDITMLAKASALALISMLIILFTVISEAFLVPPESRGTFDASLLTIRYGVFQAIGVISFAFVCHHNSLLIYGSLKTPTIDRFARITHFSTAVSALACLLMALAGFFTFGYQTQGNVLNNFPTDNIMVNIARLCFGLNMVTTLPLEAFVCREVMLTFWFPGEPFSMHLHLIFTSSLIVTAMTLSLLTCDLGAIFELIGATSACALAYILPPLCYLKLSTRSWKTIPAVVCVVFGALVMGISLFQAVTKVIRNEGGAMTCS